MADITSRLRAVLARLAGQAQESPTPVLPVEAFNPPRTNAPPVAVGMDPAALAVARMQRAARVAAAATPRTAALGPSVEYVPSGAVTGPTAGAVGFDAGALLEQALLTGAVARPLPAQGADPAVLAQAIRNDEPQAVVESLRQAVAQIGRPGGGGPGRLGPTGREDAASLGPSPAGQEPLRGVATTDAQQFAGRILSIVDELASPRFVGPTGLGGSGMTAGGLRAAEIERLLSAALRANQPLAEQALRLISDTGSSDPMTVADELVRRATVSAEAAAAGAGPSWPGRQMGSYPGYDDPGQVGPRMPEDLGKPADRMPSEFGEPVETFIEVRVPRTELDAAGNPIVVRPEGTERGPDGMRYVREQTQPRVRDGRQTFETVTLKPVKAQAADGTIIGEFTVIGRRRNTSDGNRSLERQLFVRPLGDGDYQVAIIGQPSQRFTPDELRELVATQELEYVSGPGIGVLPQADDLSQAQALGLQLFSLRQEGANASPSSLQDTIDHIERLPPLLREQALSTAGFQATEAIEGQASRAWQMSNLGRTYDAGEVMLGEARELAARSAAALAARQASMPSDAPPAPRPLGGSDYVSPGGQATVGTVNRPAGRTFQITQRQLNQGQQWDTTAGQPPPGPLDMITPSVDRMPRPGVGPVDILGGLRVDSTPGSPVLTFTMSPDIPAQLRPQAAGTRQRAVNAATGEVLVTPEPGGRSTTINPLPVRREFTFDDNKVLAAVDFLLTSDRPIDPSDVLGTADLLSRSPALRSLAPEDRRYLLTASLEDLRDLRGELTARQAGARADAAPAARAVRASAGEAAVEATGLPPAPAFGLPAGVRPTINVGAGFPQYGNRLLGGLNTRDPFAFQPPPGPPRPEVRLAQRRPVDPTFTAFGQNADDGGASAAVRARKAINDFDSVQGQIADARTRLAAVRDLEAGVWDQDIGANQLVLRLRGLRIDPEYAAALMRILLDGQAAYAAPKFFDGMTDAEYLAAAESPDILVAPATRVSAAAATGIRAERRRLESQVAELTKRARDLEPLARQGQVTLEFLRDNDGPIQGAPDPALPTRRESEAAISALESDRAAILRAIAAEELQDGTRGPAFEQLSRQDVDLLSGARPAELAQIRQAAREVLERRQLAESRSGAPVSKAERDSITADIDRLMAAQYLRERMAGTPVDGAIGLPDNTAPRGDGMPGAVAIAPFQRRILDRRIAEEGVEQVLESLRVGEVLERYNATDYASALRAAQARTSDIGAVGRGNYEQALGLLDDALAQARAGMPIADDALSTDSARFLAAGEQAERAANSGFVAETLPGGDISLDPFIEPAQRVAQASLLAHVEKLRPAAMFSAREGAPVPEDVQKSIEYVRARYGIDPNATLAEVQEAAQQALDQAGRRLLVTKPPLALRPLESRYDGSERGLTADAAERMHARLAESNRELAELNAYLADSQSYTGTDSVPPLVIDGVEIGGPEAVRRRVSELLAEQRQFAATVARQGELGSDPQAANVTRLIAKAMSADPADRLAALDELFGSRSTRINYEPQVRTAGGREGGVAAVDVGAYGVDVLRRLDAEGYDIEELIRRVLSRDQALLAETTRGVDKFGAALPPQLLGPDSIAEAAQRLAAQVRQTGAPSRPAPSGASPWMPTPPAEPRGIRSLLAAARRRIFGAPPEPKPAGPATIAEGLPTPQEIAAAGPADIDALAARIRRVRNAAASVSAGADPVALGANNEWVSGTGQLLESAATAESLLARRLAELEASGSAQRPLTPEMVRILFGDAPENAPARSRVLRDLERQASVEGLTPEEEAQRQLLEQGVFPAGQSQRRQGRRTEDATSLDDTSVADEAGSRSRTELAIEAELRRSGSGGRDVGGNDSAPLSPLNRLRQHAERERQLREAVPIRDGSGNIVGEDPVAKALYEGFIAGPPPSAAVRDIGTKTGVSFHVGEAYIDRLRRAASEGASFRVEAAPGEGVVPSRIVATVDGQDIDIPARMLTDGDLRAPEGWLPVTFVERGSDSLPVIHDRGIRNSRDEAFALEMLQARSPEPDADVQEDITYEGTPFVQDPEEIPGGIGAAAVAAERAERAAARVAEAGGGDPPTADATVREPASADPAVAAPSAPEAAPQARDPVPEPPRRGSRTPLAVKAGIGLGTGAGLLAGGGILVDKLTSGGPAQAAPPPPWVGAQPPGDTNTEEAPPDPMLERVRRARRQPYAIIQNLVP